MMIMAMEKVIYIHNLISIYILIMNNNDKLTISPINELPRTTSTDDEPFTPPPLLTIKKISGKNAPIKPNPKKGLKIKIPTSRNLNVSPIQGLKENLFFKDTKLLKEKYDKSYQKFIRINNILKSFGYFVFLIKNLYKQKTLDNKNVGILKAEKQIINNIKKMNHESKRNLLNNLKIIMIDNKLTLNFNYNDYLQEGRKMLSNEQAVALRPIIDAESQQIIELTELKKLIYKNILKNEIYQMMNHPGWDKQWLNKLMFYLEKWNFLIPDGTIDDIIKNKSKWVLKSVIKDNFLPNNKDTNPERIISMLNEGMEKKWIEAIEKSNNPKGNRKVHDEFEIGKKHMVKYDLATGKPLKFGDVIIPGLQPLVLDPVADQEWAEQLFLPPEDRAKKKGSVDSTSSKNSSSSRDSNIGFFGGKRKKKTRRKKRGGKGKKNKSFKSFIRPWPIHKRAYALELIGFTKNEIKNLIINENLENWDPSDFNRFIIKKQREDDKLKNVEEEAGYSNEDNYIIEGNDYNFKTKSKSNGYIWNNKLKNWIDDIEKWNNDSDEPIENKLDDVDIDIPWYLNTDREDKPQWNGAERLLHLSLNASASNWGIHKLIDEKIWNKSVQEFNLIFKEYVHLIYNDRSWYEGTEKGNKYLEEAKKNNPYYYLALKKKIFLNMNEKEQEEYKILEFERLPIERQNEIKQLIANNPSCSICLDEFNIFDEFSITKCDHIYHLDCIERYVKSSHKNSCPMCRADMETGEPEFVQPIVVGTRRQRTMNNLTRRFRNFTRRPRTWLQQGYRAMTRRRRNRRRRVAPRSGGRSKKRGGSKRTRRKRGGSNWKVGDIISSTTNMSNHTLSPLPSRIYKIIEKGKNESSGESVVRLLPIDSNGLPRGDPTRYFISIDYLIQSEGFELDLNNTISQGSKTSSGGGKKRTRRKKKTRKKQFLYNPNNSKKSFDVYIDKNPNDTIPIKYTTVKDVEDTIKKLERLYKTKKYSHKRIWQVGMIMKVRLEAMNKYKKTRYKKAKNVYKRYQLSKRYFKFLSKRSKEKSFKDRKKMVFKFN